MAQSAFLNEWGCMNARTCILYVHTTAALSRTCMPRRRLAGCASGGLSASRQAGQLAGWLRAGHRRPLAYAKTCARFLMAIVFLRALLARENFAQELLGVFCATFVLLVTVLVKLSHKGSSSYIVGHSPQFWQERNIKYGISPCRAMRRRGGGREGGETELRKR